MRVPADLGARVDVTGSRELAVSAGRGAAPAVVLINPNTSTSTTGMMTAIARRTLGPDVRGVTVARGPRMLTDPAALRAAAPEVAAAGGRALASGTCRALLVGAFGDPGLAHLRALSLALARGPVPVPVPVPVVGIGEAALLEAAASGRRFGIATTTPLLAESIVERVAALGLSDRFTGLRLTGGDPQALSADPESLRESLALAVQECVVRDGARAVVIGGGPLGEAADSLRARFETPVIAPIPAACRRLARLLTATPATPH
ncbi:aspartate/glutamate racemase family protein [Streptomyces sp. NPDC012508]|uniref:aspartate/glutamate racemase family protein n=1 Tax=Streptomyces sp. NPDC012508 TaxID=3364837 RepID=UPI0036A82686